MLGWGGLENIYLNLKIFNFLNFYNLWVFFSFFSMGLLQEQRAGRNRVNTITNDPGHVVLGVDVMVRKS